jgi:protein SCO1/2
LTLLVCGAGFLTSCSRQDPAPDSATPGMPSRREFDVKGQVLSLHPEELKVRIKHEAIPGYMDAMTMPFHVQDTNELAGLIPGEEVTFKLIVTEDDAWIEAIAKTGVAENILPAGAPIRIAREVEPLEAGDPLPEYHLVNEHGQEVSLSQFKGNALVLSFLFTRCPIPTFCPLTARKLVETQEQLLANSNGPTNWHILAITVDPEFDTPERLKEFGETYGYQPAQFNLLTGELIDITALAEQFGLLFWTEAGSISHNLRTVVVDANGIIQTNMVGNEWKVGTLVKDVIEAAAGDGKADRGIFRSPVR